MPAVISDLPARPSAERDKPSAPTGLRNLVLVRLSATGGATRAETIRDLSFFVAHRLSPGEWRQTAEAALGTLVDGRLALEKRGRYTATDKGLSAAADFLVLRSNVKLGGWAEVRDCQLIARALGLEAESTPKLKALGTPEGLRALVVQQAFGLNRRLKTTPAKLRGELALIALERAFGNKIKSGLGSGTALSPKAGRALAAQLSRRPREFSTDSRLIAALAAEQVAAAQPTLDVLRSAIMKRFVSEILDAGTRDAGITSYANATLSKPLPPKTPTLGAPARQRPEQPSMASQITKPLAPANDAAPASGPPPLVRPDLDEFATEVRQRAVPHAEGWSGHRKAFISHVWPSIRDGRPEWGLSDIEFKCMLVEAHRAGRLALGSADLKNKNNIKDIQDSAISYMNTVWHFVRVED
ncbi:MAG: hypothetical protein ACK5KM_04825 [Hyphomicrobiaceae bacterium]